MLAPLQTHGKTAYAMDALFGLPRKKAAGQSYREPLHGKLCFHDQLAVDEFVAQSKQSKRVKNVIANQLFNLWCVIMPYDSI